MYISVIAPVRNEEANLEELHRRVRKVLKGTNKPFEIIYVENGSTDNTMEVLRGLSGAKVISLRIPLPPKKTAQSSALDAGIKAASGELIVTIDADLQNPPEEIPKMIQMLEEEKLDVVSGWRKKRKDTIFIRNLSRFGSWLRTMFINPGVHDLGCTLKVYRRECFEFIDLHGEMHRYLVAVLKWRGFKIGEIEVDHSERAGGKSSYKWDKMFRGFVDMWLIWFTRKYSDRPLHLFGVSGIFIALVGIGLLGILGIMRMLEMISLSQSIWPLIAVLLIILGVQLFAFGMVMDTVIRSYYALGEERSYLIREQFEVPAK